MAYKDYSYSSVKGGTGSYKKESPTVYASGVEQMQIELKACGYKITDTAGHFSNSTCTAVYDFQSNISGMGKDGIAGKDTLTVLSKVKGLIYFNDYGKPIATSEWTPALIKGYTPRNCLARIIYAEDTTNANGQKGVACVIKNRSGNSSYKQSGITNKWLAVLLKGTGTGETAHYSTVNGSANACKPMRGDFSNETDFIHAMWKCAVDLAELLNGEGTPTYPTGKAVSGKSVTSTSRAITTSHYRQVGKSKYFEYVDAGTTTASALTFAFDFSGSANVFFLN